MRVPFKLDDNSGDETSEFSIDFAIDGVLYQFGFETDGNAFISEWLYAYPHRVRQIWYERQLQEFKFGKSLKGNVSAIQSLTRENSLFLSAAAQNNNDQIQFVYRFFQNIRFSGDVFTPGKTIDVDVKRIHKILEFLKYADTGIVDARVESEEAPQEIIDIMKSIDETIKRKKTKNIDIKFDHMDKLERISFGHRAAGGKIVYLDLNEESSGTVRLANLLAPILLVLEGGGVLIIDEIDASLHSLLALRIVEIFNSPEFNLHGAQLIAATHDTNLLSSASLRRDQIWFVEKDKDGASHVYPLTDFSIRRTDNLEKGYLDGRFGAIPFLGSMRGIRKKIIG